MMEPAIPIIPAHHCHIRLAARRDILRTGQAPDGGLQSEHLEIIAEHVFEDHGLRLAAFHMHGRQIVERHAGQGREDVVVIADILIFVPSPIPVVARLAGVLIQELDELLRIRDRQLVQHDGIEQAEDRGIGADAERQREHCHSREAGIAAHQPESVSQVAPEHNR